MASKAAKSKSTSAKKPAKARKPATRRKPAKKAQAAAAVPRATSNLDDQEVLLSGAATTGTHYGRCGGRILSTRIEQQVCDLLSRTGVTHSHAPRHFEIRYPDGTVAAYAPMIVLRVRGREGKTVVIEAAESIDEGTLAKIRAFRAQDDAEFYMCMIAPEEILDDISLDAYDEAATTEFAQNLVSRLAE